MNTVILPWNERLSAELNKKTLTVGNLRILKMRQLQTRPLRTGVWQCFWTPGPWHQLYRASRGSPGTCHFIFL